MNRLQQNTILLRRYRLLSFIENIKGFQHWDIEDIEEGVIKQCKIFYDKYLILAEGKVENFYEEFQAINLTENKEEKICIFADKYQIIELIAEGGFAFLWKAIYTVTGEIVALKIYKNSDALTKKELMAEWNQELVHSNLILPNHVDIADNGTLYYRMRFCAAEGSETIVPAIGAKSGTCSSLKGDFNEYLIAKFILHTSDALAFLHNKNIVHNDLKPNNFLYNVDYSDGQNGRDIVKWQFFICDLGISKELVHLNTLKGIQPTKTSFNGQIVQQIFGQTPPPYYPPEKIKGTIEIKASDIWTYGASLYQLLTNDLPFGIYGGSMQHAGKEGMPPNLPAGDFSEDLNLIVRACLLFNPEDRPTAAQLNKWAKNQLFSGKEKGGWLNDADKKVLYDRLNPKSTFFGNILTIPSPKTIQKIVFVFLVILATVLIYNIIENKKDDENTASIEQQKIGTKQDSTLVQEKIPEKAKLSDNNDKKASNGTKPEVNIPETKILPKEVQTQTDIPIITIGSQVWTAKNLNVSTFRNGDVIPQAKTKGEWEEFYEKREPSWCYYDNDPANGVKYGKLYNWYAVNDSRGLAPRGFHVPSDAEWTVLTEYLGGADIAGYKMKTRSGWGKESNGTDSSGFSGLPGGWRYYDGTFDGVGHYGTWWSSSEYDAPSAWYRGLNCLEGKVYRYYCNRGDGLSVRCLRD